MDTPSITEALELNGKIFAMLTSRETEVLNYFHDQGRKHGVRVSIINEADPVELAGANSKEEAEQIMKRANSRVSVIFARDGGGHATST